MLEKLILTPEILQLSSHKFLRSKAWKQFLFYREKSKDRLQSFHRKLLKELHQKIKNDENPYGSASSLAEELGFTELNYNTRKEALQAKERLEDEKLLEERLYQLEETKFIKTTAPFFEGIIDAISKLERQPEEEMEQIYYGHYCAIQVSDGGDRIIDKDEELNRLEDYKLMVAHVDRIATENIEPYPEVYKSYVEGLKLAKIGQRRDRELKENPRLITYQRMEECYLKVFEPIGRTARNLTKNIQPYAELLHVGAGKISSVMMIGDEEQDLIEGGKIEVPSWILYYSMQKGDIMEGLKLTLEKAKKYEEEARIMYKMLPGDFPIKPLLSLLFPFSRFFVKQQYQRVLSDAHLSTFQQQLEDLLEKIRS